jgi:hypothetical protein
MEAARLSGKPRAGDHTRLSFRRRQMARFSFAVSVTKKMSAYFTLERKSALRFSRKAAAPSLDSSVW